MANEIFSAKWHPNMTLWLSLPEKETTNIENSVEKISNIANSHFISLRSIFGDCLKWLRGLIKTKKDKQMEEIRNLLLSSDTSKFLSYVLEDKIIVPQKQIEKNGAEQKIFKKKIKEKNRSKSKKQKVDNPEKLLIRSNFSVNLFRCENKKKENINFIIQTGSSVIKELAETNSCEEKSDFSKTFIENTRFENNTLKTEPSEVEGLQEEPGNNLLKEKVVYENALEEFKKNYGKLFPWLENVKSI